MFRGLTIMQRIPIVLTLLLAFALVLGSNRMDKRHFSEIDARVNSVYKDRVLVQGYIYELSNIFHYKELEIIQENELSDQAAINQKVDRLLSDFSLTQLTREESKELNELVALFDDLKENEQTIINTSNVSNNDARSAAASTLQNINQTLDRLSDIQLEESDKLTILSKDSLRMITMLSSIEIIFLIIIGIITLVMIFYPVKE